jgi:hypothetical protein
MRGTPQCSTSHSVHIELHIIETFALHTWYTTLFEVLQKKARVHADHCTCACMRLTAPLCWQCQRDGMQIAPATKSLVTCVCRPKREGERDGVDYHFVSKEQFERWIAEDALLEDAMVYGQHKGIPRQQIADALARGSDVVLRLDVQVRTLHLLAAETGCPCEQQALKESRLESQVA